MANAGYNPLAIIVVLTKQTGTYWETLQGKPANADRAMNVYDYTSYAYPAKLKAGYSCNEYKNFLTYANTVLAERKDNKKHKLSLIKKCKNTEKQRFSNYKIQNPRRIKRLGRSIRNFKRSIAAKITYTT